MWVGGENRLLCPARKFWFFIRSCWHFFAPSLPPLPFYFYSIGCLPCERGSLPSTLSLTSVCRSIFDPSMIRLVASFQLTDGVLFSRVFTPLFRGVQTRGEIFGEGFASIFSWNGAGPWTADFFPWKPVVAVKVAESGLVNGFFFRVWEAMGLKCLLLVAYDAETSCCRDVLWDVLFLCPKLRNMFFSANTCIFVEPSWLTVLGNTVHQ